MPAPSQLLNDDLKGLPVTASFGGIRHDSPDKNLIPDHDLLQRIGLGAYGEVWLARNVLGEMRAVKIIYRSRFNEPRPFNREFEGIQRFEPISRSHPSHLAILHVGKNDAAGCFYYVMELADNASGKSENVKGGESGTHPPADFPTLAPAGYQPRTLRHDLEQHSHLPISGCIQIGLSLTTALAHLHQHRLVHRDIKPSNVIFVNGVPKLGDIGLVTEAGDTQSIVGTEGYLPPEGPGTRQADIFSLGKVLYEISTGLDRRRFAELPEDLYSWPDRHAVVEFNEILLKACAKDSERRYQSAEEMSADLELLQRGQSIKDKRQAQRRLRVVTKVSVVAALFTLILAGVLTFLGGFIFDTSHAYRLSKNEVANKEYHEGVLCYRRDRPEGLRQGRKHFLKAIELDPKFTMAYNGLFEVYLGAGLDEEAVKRRATAKKMLELDASLAEAHAALAWLDFLDWKFNDAERRFQHALKLNDQCAIAHMRYGFALVHWGRVDEGYQHLLRAEYLDPTLPRIKKNLGHVFYVRREFLAAISQYRKAIELEPSYPVARHFIAKAWLAQGEYLKAIDEFQKHDILVGEDPETVRQKWSGIQLAYETEGPTGFWAKYLEMAEKKGCLYSMAICHARLQNYDEALRLLQEAYAEHEPDSLEYLLFDECWDAVRSKPRFVDLFKKVGFR